MKKVLAIAFLLAAMVTNAQEETEEPIEGWNKKGNFSFLFNQSAFDNWLAGGTNSISGTLGLNYDFNYLKGDWSWDKCKLHGSGSLLW